MHFQIVFEIPQNWTLISTKYAHNFLELKRFSSGAKNNFIKSGRKQKEFHCFHSNYYQFSWH